MSSSAPAAVGVDVGGTKLLAIAIDAQGDIVARHQVATPTHHLGGELGSTLIEAVADVVEGLGLDDLPVGLGVPGMVDREGTLIYAPNLQSATGAKLAERCSDRMGSAVVAIDNDATCATLAELRLGALRGVSEGVLITLGTGIGGGLVRGGEVSRGAHGFAGELGHMVVDRNGPACPCGSAGCWERYTSGAGLAYLAREAVSRGELAALAGDPAGITGVAVAELAAGGDRDAQAVVAESGWWLGLGVSNLVALLDPERVVIGGGVSVLGEALLAPARAALPGMLEGGARRDLPELVTAALGPEAGAVGAALMAMEVHG